MRVSIELNEEELKEALYSYMLSSMNVDLTRFKIRQIEAKKAFVEGEVPEYDAAGKVTNG